MQALKSFIDSQGRRLRPGDTLPSDYDSQTLTHYARHGMVGEQEKLSKPVKTVRAPKPEKLQAAVTAPNIAPAFAPAIAPAQSDEAKPAETKPEGPEETHRLLGPDVIKA
jgi:hypothetical protein